MDSQEHKQLITKPQVERLKALGSGLKVGRVLGDRVLVKTVAAWTDMDRVEKEGLLEIPKAVRDANTPKESSGVVIGVGSQLSQELAIGDMVMFSMHAGSEFSVGGEEGFRILDSKEILCTLEQDGEEPVELIPVRGE